METDGRKILNIHEHIIDQKFIGFSEYLSPKFKSMGFTPNLITTLGLISGILCGKFFIQKIYFVSVFFWLLSYLFDCLDGFFARKYDMRSKLGDYYDHGCDFFKFIMINYLILYSKINRKYKIVFMIIQFILLILNAWHTGCQEQLNKFNKKNDQELWAFLKMLCKDKNQIMYSKMFGAGVYIVFVAIFILVIPLMK